MEGKGTRDEMTFKRRLERDRIERASQERVFKSVMCGSKSVGSRKCVRVVQQ
jgi:hypothetical protein